ncbi:hypothetical protein EMIHUDRAFT_455996 [Emiliania huxleyi CCMP1516]|uniref:Citrate transporter-like domain-containing protein n=2 Tax=Emiliania huxleyi TaxID=2903 RepID=A0A0D3KAE3_EMIH1|nr:hypothetical protein EMIHUDRAFT_455996 [Emiliania huxleyi CCMP1516]EOD32728.1 hypothetical protein EMIHUDRAFT_455996 [Emiliania huxleyi CCMP1516]|eukprot:XP_005785157.1 hypothetical protein EMIHUDRAFT_455996 [Emiliania huxleyi CCMP1516]
METGRLREFCRRVSRLVRLPGSPETGTRVASAASAEPQNSSEAASRAKDRFPGMLSREARSVCADGLRSSCDRLCRLMRGRPFSVVLLTVAWVVLLSMAAVLVPPAELCVGSDEACLNWESYLTVSLLLTAVLLMANGSPPDLVMLALTVALLLCGVISDAQAWAGFCSSSVLSIGALFVVARALEETRAVELMLRPLLGRPSGHVTALLRLCFPVAVVSAFLNNTPIVAMLLPARLGERVDADCPTLCGVRFLIRAGSVLSEEEAAGRGMRLQPNDRLLLWCLAAAVDGLRNKEACAGVASTPSYPAARSAHLVLVEAAVALESPLVGLRLSEAAECAVLRGADVWAVRRRADTRPAERSADGDDAFLLDEEEAESSAPPREAAAARGPLSLLRRSSSCSSSSSSSAQLSPGDAARAARRVAAASDHAVAAPVGHARIEEAEDGASQWEGGGGPAGGGGGEARGGGGGGSARPEGAALPRPASFLAPLPSEPPLQPPAAARSPGAGVPPAHHRARAATADLAVALPAGGTTAAAGGTAGAGSARRGPVPPGSPTPIRPSRSAPVVGLVGLARGFSPGLRPRVGTGWPQLMQGLPLRPGDTLLLEAPDSWVQANRILHHFALLRRVAQPWRPRSVEAVERLKLAASLSALLLLLVCSALDLVSLLPLALSIAYALAWRSISYRLVLTIACSFGPGAALTNTGVAAALGAGLVELQVLGSFGFLLCIYLTTSALSCFVSNSAAVVAFYSVLRDVRVPGLNSEQLMVAMMLGGSSAFATPIGYQTNLMVLGRGGYAFTDFMALGGGLTLVVGCVVSAGCLVFLADAADVPPAAPPAPPAPP